jgi:hypothetical protein
MPSLKVIFARAIDKNPQVKAWMRQLHQYAGSRRRCYIQSQKPGQQSGVSTE